MPRGEGRLLTRARCAGCCSREPWADPAPVLVWDTGSHGGAGAGTSTPEMQLAAGQSLLSSLSRSDCTSWSLYPLLQSCPASRAVRFTAPTS